MSNPNDNTGEEPAKPLKLELSLSPEDGSLQTAPLSTVLLAATTGLHSDLYNMAHGEMEVAQQQQSQQQQTQDENNNNEEDESSTPLAMTMSTKKERMSNLSFAQRRHELAFRISQHGKSLEKVAALTAAAASGDLGRDTCVATKALQYARTAWVQADEAQDALYFFHARLFPARQPPHDVLGALDILKNGQWNDLPSDLKLNVDPYDKSDEKAWTAGELANRWHMAVREKLIRGEVGRLQRIKLSYGIPKPMWRVSLRGGVLRLTHGSPRKGSTPPIYPLDAHVSVLTTLPNPDWTLLSVKVRVEAKTGESNHQIDTSNRQQYDLHRLCAQAMAKEEARAKTQDVSLTEHPARPLDCLFRVAHAFCLSWQMEILSAQSQALRKGAWSSSSADSSSTGLSVTPVEFTDNVEADVLGEMSIFFWNVDDRYGPPCMGDLFLENAVDGSRLGVEDVASVTTSSSATRKKSSLQSSRRGQLCLSIRAESQVGIRVSLSGGEIIMDSIQGERHAQSTLEQLLDATSNPFSLSVSDALLAATRLCAERKCRAVTQALQPNDGGASRLPCWIHLTVERGSIAVAAHISGYRGKACSTSSTPSQNFVVLFRLECDARTGSFVATFSRSATLLRLLACNHVNASQVVAIRTAKLAQNGRKAVAHGTGRVVRENFDALTRSMNVLGERTGLGGLWDDMDDQSPSLRQRAVQLACLDVRGSLMTCCGLAAIYGLSALALGAATGVTAAVDEGGEAIEPLNGISFVSAPPLSIVLDQQLVEREYKSKDGELKKQSLIERNLFAVSCAVTDNAVTLHGFDITMQLDSPSSFEHERVGCSLLTLMQPEEDSLKVNGNAADGGPRKRRRLDGSGAMEEQNCQSRRYDMLLDEVEQLTSVFSHTIGSS